MGNNLDTDKNIIAGSGADMDKMDITPPAGGPADELMLESTNPACICLHAYIGRMAVVGDVMLVIRD